MKRIVFIIAAFFGCIFFLGGARAQEYCADILKSGIWEINSSSTSSEYQRSYLNWFCNESSASQESFRDRGGQATLPIDGLPVKFKGFDRQKNWKSYKTNACSRQQEFLLSFKDESHFSQTASSTLVSAWQNCMKKNGLSVSTMTTHNSANFVSIIAVYRQVASAVPTVKLSRLSVKEIASSPGSQLTDASCTIPELPITLKHDIQQSFLCLRDRCKTTIITPYSDDISIVPTPPIIIGKAADCNPPPPCQHASESNECLHCRFENIQVGLSQNSPPLDLVCPRMPPNMPLKTKIDGVVYLDTLPAGGVANISLVIGGKKYQVTPPDRPSTTKNSIPAIADMAKSSIDGKGLLEIAVSECSFGQKKYSCGADIRSIDIYTENYEPPNN